MQTVRKYAYLIVIGLVAALVFSNSLNRIIFQSTESILPNIGEIREHDLPIGFYGLGLVMVLVAFLIIRNAVFGLPRKFFGGLKILQRRIMFIIAITTIGAMFFLA